MSAQCRLFRFPFVLLRGTVGAAMDELQNLSGSTECESISDSGEVLRRVCWVSYLAVSQRFELLPIQYPLYSAQRWDERVEN